ncbi:DNA-binding protein SMUBP-2 [Cordyceps fumosorosea ARSEF 2679]|uniref:Diphthine--ammonia ligase n=1 Tax=Cordyceps fumosorosea (strain ARSEF 2679) TaxID=1081104 RepID=A0A167ZHF2_CORFA|nr:DNA-binding protein SMUBP-2 [Cordyceps fumosorosea ARSEF 2679]OAA67521.1 DNA-binding protein SMUBP-2 [Cordyceps fumosorosea ARSEF 2679]
MATGKLNVIALISGGKDSFYSLLHCLRHGHRIVALANLHPPVPSTADSQQDEADLNSFMYQTVGHEVVPLYAEATGIPLYRQPIAGSAAHHERDYAHDASAPVVDETESMMTLLCAVKERHPEADALCSGAILSTYQRTRVESVAARLGLTPLAYLWKYTALPAAPAEDDESRLLLDMAAAGLEARIVKVASAGLDEGHLWDCVSSEAGAGRVKQALRKFGAAEGASLGEGGEFETLVVDGPACLFKKRVVVPEQGTRVVREGGGSVWLLTRGAHLQDKDASDADFSVNVRVPELFDPKFAQVLDDLVARPDEPSEPVIAGYETQPLSKTSIVSNAGPELLAWNFISDETYEASLIAEETKSIVRKLKEALTTNGLSVAQLTTVIIVLRNMADFPKINQEYGSIFDSPNPASRVTISCGNLLPEGRNVMLYATTPPASPTLTRDGLHVQSRSYWAPANIGPYSQAIEIPITRNLVALGPRSVYVAGQIPLIPHSMTLPAPSGTALAEQITLSLQHLWRVGAQMKVQQWTSAVAYFDRAASAEDMRRRARLAGWAWHAMHAAVPDDEEDAALDPWDLKYNAQYASLAVSSKPAPLPDWEVFPMRQQNEPGTCVPPFFAVEVEELPRGAAVEWHAHAGLSGLAEASTQMVSHDESRLDGWRSWSTVVRAEGGVFVHTVLADVGDSGTKATVGGVAATAQAKYREAIRLLGADVATAEAPYLMYVDKDSMAGWGEALHDVQLPCAIVPSYSIWTADGKRASCVAVFRLSVGAS